MVEGSGLENRQGCEPLEGSNPSLSASRVRSGFDFPRCRGAGRGVSSSARRGGRVAEGAPLLREYRLIPYRGFESLPLRQDFRTPRGACRAFCWVQSKVEGVREGRLEFRGEMAEWLKAHAWKACVGQPTVGSNPTLSARFPCPAGQFSSPRSMDRLGAGARLGRP